MDPRQPYHVLVVEDDPNHSLLIQLAFESGDPLARIHTTGGAEEAIAFLISAADTELEGGLSVLPAVIVLDIAMPGIGGLGVLAWLSTQKGALIEIPVIVFTSSDDPDLARECFALGAREYKEKPVDFLELVETTHRVLARWRPPAREVG